MSVLVVFIPVLIIYICAWYDTNFHPRFPRVREGVRVTVIVSGIPCHTRMFHISRWYFKHYASCWMKNHDWDRGLPDGHDRCYFTSEGVTWCFGWTGKHVDALKAVAAL